LSDYGIILPGGASVATFGEFLKGLRDRQRMSLRDVERECGVSNTYLSQIEKGERSAPSPDILRKLARAYNVPSRYLMEQAGYLDEPEVTATDEERVDAAFDYVMADPDYKLGARIRREGLNTEAKRGIVITYETVTGKKLLTP
jgi:transcriptional regulator with XRE-family HTH domain